MKTSRALALTAILYFLCLPVPRTSAQQTFTLKVGNLKLDVTPVKGTVLSPSVNPSDRFTGTLSFQTNQGTRELSATGLSLSELSDQINRLRIVTAYLAAGPTQQQLVVQTSGQSEKSDLAWVSSLTAADGLSSLLFSSSPTPDFLISLNAGQAADLVKARIQVLVQLPNGQVQDLTTDGPQPLVWRLHSSEPPIAVLRITADEKACKEDTTAFAAGEFFAKHCLAQFLIARNTAQGTLNIGMEVQPKGLAVSHELLDDEQSAYVVNGWTTLNHDQGPFVIASTADAWHVGWYRRRDGCRFYTVAEGDHASVDLWPEAHENAMMTQNGIMVGGVKVFDVGTLRKMLADTANQLATISGFNNASIVSALTNLQGVTRDASYFAAQVTTTPLPGVTSNLANTAVGTTSSTLGSATPSGTSSIVTLQCPDGTVPTSAQGCTLPAGTAPATSSSTVTNTSSTNPSATTQQTAGTNTNQQSGITTTLPSISPTVPTAPVSTAFAAPTNVGLSSGDVLSEQVQLNAQITSLRLLLQGALSDQYLLKNSRAVATRQQATLGFSISLDPPRQYRHAVAEVRIVVIPRQHQDPVSIVTLLPTEKTYNVAKVTSHQNSFGAGVAVQPVSVGVNTGKSKDRLYLAKDTDTIALQFPLPPPLSKPMGRPVPQRVHDLLKTATGFQDLGTCGNDDRIDTTDSRDRKIDDDATNAVMFGWQFRPVLGADFVQAGQRQVFAQLALPVTIDQPYVPTVWVQTRWRAYDPKRQVVGAIYAASCFQKVDVGGVGLVNVPKVRNLEVADLGGGQLRLTASGDFYSSTMTVLAGSTPLTPLAFDGKKVEVFANARDLLQANDLVLVGQNGQNSPFAISIDKAKQALKVCRIQDAVLHATPNPDGNARVALDLKLEPGYLLEDAADGEPHHLVLAGSTVYGLRETPFVETQKEKPCHQKQPGTSVECHYKFLAPTSDLRNSQSFLVRDLAWQDMQATGNMVFAPSFSSLTVSSADDSSGTNPRTVYSLSGFDLHRLRLDCDQFVSRDEPYLQILVGNKSIKASDVGFTVATDNLAYLSIDKQTLGNAKTIRLRLSADRSGDAATSVEWDLPVPEGSKEKATTSPTYLHVGDSETVSFGGGDYSAFSSQTDTVKFEDQSLTATYNGKSKTLDVFLSSKVTAIAGHKELIVTMKGKKPLSLSIDVFRR